MNAVSNETKTINMSPLQSHNKLNKNNKQNPANSLKVTDKLIQALEKEKETINDQIQSLRDSNMDQKLKQSNITDLEKQIKQIDAKIAEIKSEKLTHKKENEKRQEKKNSSTEKNANDEQLKNSKQLDNLVKVVSKISKVSKMNTIKAKMQRQINTILSEPDPIKGTYSKYKLNKIDTLSANISKLDENIASTMKEIHRTEKRNINTEKKQASKEIQTNNSIANDTEDSQNNEAVKGIHKKVSKKAKVNTYA